MKKSSAPASPPVDTTIISKKSAVSQYGAGPDMVLKEPSVVQLKLTRADVKQVERQDTDLVITLQDGQVMIVRNFFDGKGHANSHLVLTDDAEGIWLMDAVSGEGKVQATYSNLYTIDPLLESVTAQDGGYGDAMSTSLMTWGASLGALTLASMQGSDDKKVEAQEAAPDTHIQTATVTSAAGEWPLTGTATPGHTVKITFPSGNSTIVQVQEDGSFSADLPAAETLRQGEQILVEIVDADGQVSESATVDVDAVAALPATHDLLNPGTAQLDELLAKTLATSADSASAASHATPLGDPAWPSASSAADTAALLQATQQISLI